MSFSKTGRKVSLLTGPAAVVMEGLLCYLPENYVRSLLQRCCQIFSKVNLYPSVLAQLLYEA
ncbi:hypothetical protein BDW75DRAFT_214182 [Aspergillus navahoensis]